MRIGVHTRIAKGLGSAIARAEEIGCEAIQIFSSNPNAWKISEMSETTAEIFKSGVSRLGLCPVVLHTPYLLNLASMKDDVWNLSRFGLAAALNRAEMLGGDYVVTHIGSHGGQGYDFGADRIARAVGYAIWNSTSPAMVLLEAGSGSGNTIGSTFEELADLLERLPDIGDRVGICLDTAHLWGAGYDVSTPESVYALVDRFDELIGIDRLKLLHLNDTLKELGSKIDRHWHLGLGKIGLEGFRAIVNHPKLARVGAILETPESENGRDLENIERLKSLRVDGP